MKQGRRRFLAALPMAAALPLAVGQVTTSEGESVSVLDVTDLTTDPPTTRVIINIDGREVAAAAAAHLPSLIKRHGLVK